MAFTERLIEAVKKYPILYDLSNTDYKNNRKKGKMWDEIGVELKEGGSEIKKKWKNLRDTYAKYLRSVKTRTAWQWAPQMEYFKPFLAFAKTDSNVADISLNESQNETVEFGEVLNAENIVIDSQKKVSKEDVHTHNHKKITKVELENKTNTKNTSTVESVLNYLQNKQKPPDMDAIETIFLGYAKTLKTFSLKRQAITKMKMAQLFMEQELEHLEEISSLSFQNHHETRPSSSATSSSSKTNYELQSSSSITAPNTPLPLFENSTTQQNYLQDSDSQRESIFSFITTYDPLCEYNASEANL